jgi:hypothetical protein
MILEKEILLESKGFSVNKMFYKTRNITTTAYKDWRNDIFDCLAATEVIEELSELREAFSTKEHRYEFEIIHYYPREVIFTKEEVLSSRAFDVSNVEKPLIDILTLPKYFKMEEPYKVHNLNIDDKFISDLISRKRASEDGEYRIKIRVRILPLKDIL